MITMVIEMASLPEYYADTEHKGYAEINSCLNLNFQHLHDLDLASHFQQQPEECQFSPSSPPLSFCDPSFANLSNKEASVDSGLVKQYIGGGIDMAEQPSSRLLGSLQMVLLPGIGVPS